MKRQIVFATAFSAALAVGAAAQTGSQAQQERPQQQQSQRGEQVTMIGCLERSTSGTAGTTGTTGTSGQAEFILTDAERSGASGTSGTAGTAGKPSTMGGARYKLMGGDREDLQKYLNSKVEIRGTLDKSSMSGSGAATGTGTAGTRAGQREEDKLPVLHVTSVRQVSPTCDK